jgi:hypothetical protein
VSDIKESNVLWPHWSNRRMSSDTRSRLEMHICLSI